MKRSSFSKIFGAALMGLALLGPATADPVYTVTFSNGSVYFQQSQQYNGHGQQQTRYGQVYGQQYDGYDQQYDAYGRPYEQGCDAYEQPAGGQWQVYPAQQDYQCPNSAGNYQQPTETVWQPVEPPTRPAFANDTGTFAAEVLRLTNQERAQRGLAPLAPHSALAAAATGHSQEMLSLGYFSHSSPTPGRSNPQDRVRLAGANPGLVAENIFQASGYDVSQVAQLAVENWLQSPGHRRNMLDPQATHLGVGFVEQDGTVAVTQVFGNRL